MSETLIELEHVCKRYGDKLAVNDLSLSVKAGELFAFLGPNGAGKTTTIKMMTGLLRASSGKVVVAGNDMSLESAEVRLPISFVPDQPYLYDKLTARDFLHFTRDIFGLAGKEYDELEEELIQLFQMEPFVDTLIETYSHGMRQRAAFAAAMIKKPRVLIVDEPMVGLDPENMRIVKDLLAATARSGSAVFMSTHTLAIAEEVADRVGIINKGKLICCGTLEELRKIGLAGRSLEDFFLEVTHPSDTRKDPPHSVRPASKESFRMESTR